MYRYLDECARKSKLLQNAALFRIRNCFTAHGKETLTVNEQTVMDEVDAAVRSGMKRPKSVISYHALDRIMRINRNPDFFAGLPMQSAQECLKQKCREFRGWLASLREYRKDSSRFLGKPKMPGYIRSNTAIVKFTNQDCVLYGRDMKFPLTEERVSFGDIPDENNLKEVQSVPDHGGYTLIAVFETPDEKSSVSDMPNRAAIDFGVNNFAAIAPDTEIPCLICKGGVLKAENQWYNKQMADMRAVLMKGNDPKTYRCRTTGRMDVVSRHRNRLFSDYFHKLAKYIVCWCIDNRIGTLVYGHTGFWKQRTGIGKKNNQDFVQIPFMSFVRILRYLCEKAGIQLIEQEESYTSQASAADGDDIPVYGTDTAGTFSFSGKRIRRGLYRTGNGRTVNADLNGAANILRKAIPDAYSGRDIYRILREVQVVRFSTLYKVSG